MKIGHPSDKPEDVFFIEKSLEKPVGCKCHCAAYKKAACVGGLLLCAVC